MGRRRAALVGFVVLEFPCVFSFCTMEREDSFERKNKVKVINNVKTMTMYTSGVGAALENFEINTFH